jgi:hypothetical protein
VRIFSPFFSKVESALARTPICFAASLKLTCRATLFQKS